MNVDELNEWIIEFAQNCFDIAVSCSEKGKVFAKFREIEKKAESYDERSGMVFRVEAYNRLFPTFMEQAREAGTQNELIQLMNDFPQDLTRDELKEIAELLSEKKKGKLGRPQSDEESRLLKERFVMQVTFGLSDEYKFFADHIFKRYFGYTDRTIQKIKNEYRKRIYDLYCQERSNENIEKICRDEVISYENAIDVIKHVEEGFK